MTMPSNYLLFLIIFIVLLALREHFTYKKKLFLKYLFTPLITLTAIISALYSLTIHNTNTYNILIITGLIFALIGDTLLMIEEVDLFMYGLLFFLFTQILYIFAFKTGYNFELWNIIPAIGLIVFICFFYNIIQKKKGRNNFPVLIYMSLIAVMFYFAVSKLNNVSAKGIFISIGALLFVISDIILAVNKFIKKIPNSTIIVWALYAPGQLLIGLSNYY